MFQLYVTLKMPACVDSSRPLMTDLTGPGTQGPLAPSPQDPQQIIPMEHWMVSGGTKYFNSN